MGDPCGIGPEIIARWWAAQTGPRQAVVLGCPQLMTQVAAWCAPQLKVMAVTGPEALPALPPEAMGPARDPDHPQAPRPDSRELGAVCRWLDQWRLVTTELYVIPPTYQRVAVSVSVAVQPGYGLDAVRDWVAQLLHQYLSPLPPFGPDGRGWPLGRTVMARELEAVAMQAEGVAYVEALQLAREERTVDAEGATRSTWTVVERAPLADWVVPELAAVTVVDDATALPAPGVDVAPPLTEAPVPVPVLPTVC